jgi:hypothetical protein
LFQLIIQSLEPVHRLGKGHIASPSRLWASIPIPSTHKTSRRRFRCKGDERETDPRSDVMAVPCLGSGPARRPKLEPRQHFEHEWTKAFEFWVVRGGETPYVATCNKAHLFLRPPTSKAAEICAGEHAPPAHDRNSPRSMYAEPGLIPKERRRIWQCGARHSKDADVCRSAAERWSEVINLLVEHVYERGIAKG